jgi:ubiquinone biosynthesis protein UbiJ
LGVGGHPAAAIIIFSSNKLCDRVCARQTGKIETARAYGRFLFVKRLAMATTSSFLSPQRALMVPALAAINHLLAQEAWARDALALHGGKEACIDTGHLRLRLRVSRDGMVESSSSEEPADVTIHVKLADLPLIAQNRDRAFSYVRIEGDAEFANTISQLSKGLRWDAEHDIERVLGPIGATRLVGGARSVAASAGATGRRLAENLAEYFLEENPVLVRPTMAGQFADDVSRLRDDVERLDKRIAKLDQKLQRSSPVPGTTRPGGDTTLDR